MCQDQAWLFDQMAYSQSKKTSNSERKLQALKVQLYGKGQWTHPQQGTTTYSLKSAEESKPTSSPKQLTTTVDANYLKKDLLRIAFLTTLAIAAQLLIFLSQQHQLSNFFKK